MTNEAVTLGADPELFITDLTGNVVPICGKIGGTKRRPIRLADNINKDYKLQEDNVMAEFNIPAVTSASDFSTAITTALTCIQDKFDTMGFRLSKSSEVLFKTKDLAQYPSALEFGCAPDFNAHDSGNVIPRISPAELVRKSEQWRFAGGHVHIGYKSEVPAFVAASFADYFLGLPSVVTDPQKERRKYYGQAGRYRPTSYGIEYRTLSNYWIWDRDQAFMVGVRAAELGIFLATRPVEEIRSLYMKIPWLSVQEAINTNNATISDQILRFMQPDLVLEY